FDRLSMWRDIRKLPLDEQLKLLRDPEVVEQLVHIANTEEEDFSKVMPAQARKPSDWDWVFILDHVDGTPNRRLGEVAREREEDPVKTMIDVGVEQELDTLYMVPLANEHQDTVLEIMREPRSLVTFSDGGAHVSQIMDSSLQTHVLAHWVRNSGEVTLEQGVKYLTWYMATAWELPDRGLLRRGYKADLILFDLDTVGPERPTVEHDLPAGQRRLVQKAKGYHMSIVNGGITMRDGEPTGVTSGQVLTSV
ncbi:MAG: amidohydrolase family protein, partial [Chloroflexi bacterium]|nr:amidohydrolase family protein [Chloroflexota bacterium]